MSESDLNVCDIDHEIATIKRTSDTWLEAHDR